MIKRFDTTANLELYTALDIIENSLRCSKYSQVASRIEVCVPETATISVPANREVVKKGFGMCLIGSNGDSVWPSIIINTENCTRARLTVREIAAVIVHELGHLLNEPELQDEPTFEFCCMHGLKFNKDILDAVRESNCLRMEIFADSYANRHGYGEEQISTFHKQNDNFEQQIGCLSARIEKLVSDEYFEGRITRLFQV